MTTFENDNFFSKILIICFGIFYVHTTLSFIILQLNVNSFTFSWKKKNKEYFLLHQYLYNSYS